MNITPIGYVKNNYNTYPRINKQAFASSYKSNNRNEENQMDNLEFKRYKIKFPDEAEEKMKTMTLSEKIEYAKELKSCGCYTVIGLAEDPEAKSQDKAQK